MLGVVWCEKAVGGGEGIEVSSRICTDSLIVFFSASKIFFKFCMHMRAYLIRQILICIRIYAFLSR